ncbi:hypothetical protein H2248_005506 [Termitomyces sp. 'cryptogamus']|nr:hypothetical protein H2248_005506 [Termitomyces sp. 'cryptogamus']
MIKVGKLEHAKEMFDNLVKIHQNTNVGISANEMDPPPTLSNHISSISATNTKLTAMKKQIDHKFLTLILLHSLPNDNMWESFCTTFLNLLALEKALSFSEHSNHFTFQATAQQGASADAGLKADSNAKSKPKAKPDKWCKSHKVTSHNTSNCRTLKEQKKEKKREKAKAKANHASHGPNSDSEDLDGVESDTEVTAGYSNIKTAHVSKALMSQILAYARSASNPACSSTIADSGTSVHMTPH